MTKDELVEALGDALRLAQNRSQVFDDLAAERLGINLTDLRCLDIVERLGSPTAGTVAREAGLSSGAMTAAWIACSAPATFAARPTSATVASCASS